MVTAPQATPFSCDSIGEDRRLLHIPGSVRMGLTSLLVRLSAINVTIENKLKSAGVCVQSPSRPTGAECLCPHAPVLLQEEPPSANFACRSSTKLPFRCRLRLPSFAHRASVQNRSSPLCSMIVKDLLRRKAVRSFHLRTFSSNGSASGHRIAKLYVQMQPRNHVNPRCRTC
jgi:hypothetical protein